MAKTSKKPTKITISDYINENQKLISVLGIFGALSAFFINLGEDAKYLAVLSFSLFLLVCWSAWKTIPNSEEISVPLRIFEYLFWLLAFNLVIFYYKKFPSDFQSFLTLIIVMLFGWMIFVYKPENRIYKLWDYINDNIKNKIIRNSVIFIIGVIIVVIIALISYLMAKFIVFLMSKYLTK